MTRTTVPCLNHAAFDAAVIAKWRDGKDTYTIARELGIDESAVHRMIIAERAVRLGHGIAA